MLFLGWRSDSAPDGTHHAPGGHPRNPFRPSGAGRGHQSYPRDSSRRPEDNHTEMASLACGTAAGDHHKSPPANPAGHSVPRVLWRAGMARRPRDEPVRGSPRPPRVDFGHSCTAVLLGGCHGLFWGDIIRLLFGELDALTPPDCSGILHVCPRGLGEGSL